MKDSGYSNFVSHSWNSAFVRSDTPKAIVRILHEGFKTAMASAEGKA